MDFDNGDEDRELLNIEDNSQKLESLYKNMEHLKRENMLFEAYLLRNCDTNNMDDEGDDKRKKQKNEKKIEKQVLTNEEKYDIANQEAEALKKNIDEGRIKSDGILETLRAILEETDMAITEIRKDAFEFQREILIGGENSRTGKIEAEKVIKYREEKLRQKDTLIEKYKAKKATLESQIFKTENLIKRKEEMGDDLKFIDFHQLQIENKKYVKEINEKNDKLIQLKIQTGKIINKLTKKRKNLNQCIMDQNKLEDDIKAQLKQIEKSKIDINLTSIAKDEEFAEYKRYQQQVEQQKNLPNKPPHVPEYALLKKKIQTLEYNIKNLQRKKEINKIQYREALKYFQTQKQSEG